MADNVLITEYREVEIYFNIDKETFWASIDDPDEHWNKPKKTFSSVQKTIDEYHKENSEFKPFTIIFYRNYSYNKENGEIRKIVSLRKDGRFVYEDPKGIQHQLSESDEKYCLFDCPENTVSLAAMRQYKLRADAANKSFNSIRETLKSLNLKEIKAKYLI